VKIFIEIGIVLLAGAVLFLAFRAFAKLTIGV